MLDVLASMKIDAGLSRSDSKQPEWHVLCRKALHIGALSRTSPKGCPKRLGHKGDPGVTPGTCGANGERAQVILVWVRAPGVVIPSHPRRLGVMRVWP